MKRCSKGLFVIGVAALVSLGWMQQASAGDWAGKPAHRLEVVRDPARIQAITQPGNHPWALTEGGAGWFKSREGIAKVKRAFHQFSEQNLQRYLSEGRVLDCADVALQNLADFLQHEGLRGAMKVYSHGAKYIDSADFTDGEGFARFIRTNFGALNVIDNMRTVVRANRVSEPADLEVIKPGHTRMLVHIPRETTERDRKGVPRMGHTQPISEVHIGETLADSHLVTIYGNYDNGHALPVNTTLINVADAISLDGLSRNETFRDLGPVRTGAAKIYDYNAFLEGQPHAVAEQALAMGWQMIEKGLGELGE